MLLFPNSLPTGGSPPPTTLCCKLPKPSYCQGYRTKGSGHHSTTFEFLGITLGAGFEALADYFDRCRVKRNIADYVGAGSISETEAEDLLEEARAFAQTARAWIATNYPNLAGWKEKR
jgi:hypothetical protein